MVHGLLAPLHTQTFFFIENVKPVVPYKHSFNIGISATQNVDIRLSNSLKVERFMKKLYTA